MNTAQRTPTDIRETHISVVTLTGDRAEKRLKPVSFDFLDFSTRAGRYANLANEVRLNRRLAGDVYRGLRPIWHNGDGWTGDGSGPPDDWLLEMTRLPDNATLAAALRDGRASETDIDAVVRTLADFYDRTDRGPAVAANGDPAVLRVNLTENLNVLDAAVESGMIAANATFRLRSRQLQMLEVVAAEVLDRMAAGWVRDVHGDLRAEHVYLRPDGPPRILDCIAFNHRLRWIDIADDVAFLATDLIRLGGERLADRLTAGYRHRMNDPISENLLAFFRSYRFAVRAKVAVLRGWEKSNTGETASAADTVDLVARAAAELHGVRPWLLAVCGLSGSGKSTLAAALAERIGAVHLSSDRIRKELHGLSPTDCGGDELYTLEATERTYAALCERAGRLLADGCGVVLDATFLRRADRDRAFALGDAHNVRPLFVECRCDDLEAARRLAFRVAGAESASDAGVAVREQQREQSAGWSGMPEGDMMAVETAAAGADSLAEIVSRLVGR